LTWQPSAMPMPAESRGELLERLERLARNHVLVHSALSAYLGSEEVSLEETLLWLCVELAESNERLLAHLYLAEIEGRLLPPRIPAS